MKRRRRRRSTAELDARDAAKTSTRPTRGSLPPMSPRAAEREIIKAARRLTRLQTMKRAAMNRVRAIDADIKIAKRELRQLTVSVTGLDRDSLPLREFGELGGIPAK